MPLPPQAASVLDFWLGDGVELGWPSQDMSKRWFQGGPELDRECHEKFGDLVTQAVAGKLQDWAAEPLGRLALVLLLDQFARNIYRGKPAAFSGDVRAQQLVKDALTQRIDEQLPWIGRVFLYMPLMHAEDLLLQEEGVRRFARLAGEAPEELRAGIESNLRFAQQHRDIVARFGRFPYRNAALGRTNTALEFDFIKNGPRFGQ